MDVSLPEHLSDRVMRMAVAMLLVIYFCIISKISLGRRGLFNARFFVAVQPNIITSPSIFEQSCAPLQSFCCDCLAWPGHSYLRPLNFVSMVSQSLFVVSAPFNLGRMRLCVWVQNLLRLQFGVSGFSFHYFRWCCCCVVEAKTHSKPKVSMLSIFHYFILMLI